MGQVTCQHCRTLVSVSKGACEHHGVQHRCECGQALAAWAGIAGFHDLPDGSRSETEIVEGPCPRCGAALISTWRGLWD